MEIRNDNRDDFVTLKELIKNGKNKQVGFKEQLPKNESIVKTIVAFSNIPGGKLINALIHRDYINQGRDIKVGIYDDIVNIVSCGSYPNTINQTDIENGRSEARNRVIANIFKELGLIEQWGSGIARIKSSCLEMWSFIDLIIIPLLNRRKSVG
jgi:predicted HTH transcriptional regulator